MAVLAPGTQLKHGTFVVTSELGKGGFGEVYLARQPRMDRDCAVKVLLPRVADNPDIVARFQREALAAASISHPNVLPVYDFDYDDDAGVWFLAMQYVRGGKTLKDRMTGPLDLVQTARIIYQVAGVLDEAHSRNIIHRDVKPANVLMDGDRPLLTDFGIAHLGTMTGLTATGMAIGTPTYMSPEQAMGKPVGPKADQYALAVMSYEMLAGRPPFMGDALSLINQQVNTPPPPLGSFNPSVNAAARAAVVLAMSKNPDDRYAHCSEFAVALLSAAGDTQMLGTNLSTSPFAAPGGVTTPAGFATPGSGVAPSNVGTAGTGVRESGAAPPQASRPNWDAVVEPRTGMPATGDGASPQDSAATIRSESVPAGAGASVADSRSRPTSAPGSDVDLRTATPLSNTLERSSGEVSVSRGSIDALRSRELPAARPSSRGINKVVIAGAAAAVVVVLAGIAGFVTTQRPQAEPPSPPTATTIAIGQPDRPTEVPSTPLPSSGAIAVRSLPDGAAVTVDGEPTGRSPRLLNLRPGRHVITLSLPSYREFSREVQVDEGERVDLPADLVPLPAIDLLEVTETRIGRDPHLNASNFIRLGEFTDDFRLQDDVNAVVYLKSRAFDIRDFAFSIKYRWSRVGTNPIELTGRQEAPKNLDQLYLHTCAPALALDNRGTGAPLTVQAFVDDEQVAELTFKISGGNPANASRSPCDTSSLPRTFT